MTNAEQGRYITVLCSSLLHSSVHVLFLLGLSETSMVEKHSYLPHRVTLSCVIIYVSVVICCYRRDKSLQFCGGADCKHDSTAQLPCLTLRWWKIDVPEGTLFFLTAGTAVDLKQAWGVFGTGLQKGTFAVIPVATLHFWLWNTPYLDRWSVKNPGSENVLGL